MVGLSRIFISKRPSSSKGKINLFDIKTLNKFRVHLGLLHLSPHSQNMGSHTCRELCHRPQRSTGDATARSTQHWPAGNPALLRVPGTAIEVMCESIVEFAHGETVWG